MNRSQAVYEIMESVRNLMQEALAIDPNSPLQDSISYIHGELEKLLPSNSREE